MIAKPCPGCGRPDAGCDCPPYFETECRNCGATVLGRDPPDGCHRCTPSRPVREGFPWVDL